jgi:hypothetical protein
VSNLTRKLTKNLDFRADKQRFWRWWSGEQRRKIKGHPFQRFGNKEEGYRWVNHGKGQQPLAL